MAHIKAHKRRNLKLGAVAAYGLFTYRGGVLPAVPCSLWRGYSHQTFMSTTRTLSLNPKDLSNWKFLNISRMIPSRESPYSLRPLF